MAIFNIDALRPGVGLELRFDAAGGESPGDLSVSAPGAVLPVMPLDIVRGVDVFKISSGCSEV
jgi:hypothetical protein